MYNSHILFLGLFMTFVILCSKKVFERNNMHQELRKNILEFMEDFT